MVVIKSERSSLTSRYSEKGLDLIESYSSVIGYSFEQSEGELKVELNPDRADLFSFNTLVRSAEMYFSSTAFPQERAAWKGRIILKSGALRLRPYVRSFIAEGREIGEYMEELIDFQEKIHLSVGKDRKKSSIGLHDLDKIKLPVIYDSGNTEDISFETYDGSMENKASEILRRHSKGSLYGKLIGDISEAPFMFDSDGDVLSMPPVINGIKSVIEPATKKFFVDITGTDMKATDDTMFLMKHFFSCLGYKTFFTRIEGLDPKNFALPGMLKLKIRPGRVRKFLNVDMSGTEIAFHLKRMGYIVRNNADSIEINVPSYRIDVMGEADIMEDIAKSFGFNNLKEKELAFKNLPERNISRTHEETLRGILVGAGFQEIMSFFLVPSSFYSVSTYQGDMRILNPKSQDFSVMRDRLLLGILDFYSRNRNRNYPQNVFEIGEVVLHGKQESHVCISIAQPGAAYSSIKRQVEYLFRRIGNFNLTYTPFDSEDLMEGRSAKMTLSGRDVGLLGEVKPDRLESFGIKVPVALSEINIPKIFIK